jgi:hypothetical protein
MMIRHQLVTIGDTHLTAGPLNEDRRDAIRFIVHEGSALPKLACWFWPGDLNHGAMTISDRNFLAEMLTEMAGAAPVVLCYGNHDRPGDLDVFGRLNTRFPVIVVSSPRVIYVELATGDGIGGFFVLPYPHKAGLVAAGTPLEHIPIVAGDALEAVCRHGALLLDRARIEERVVLTAVVGHVNIAGALLSSGQPNIGQEIELHPQHLDLFGPVPKLFAHIHKAQEMGGGAYYAGSVCRLDWGETDSKGYLLVDVLHDTSFVVRFQPIPVPPMYHVEAELMNPHTLLWRLDPEEIPPDSFEGADVRVRYRFPAGQGDALALADIARGPFMGARRLVLEPIPVNARAVRAPEVAAAITLHEKAGAYATHTGVQWTPELVDLLQLLETPDPDTFTRVLNARLAAKAAAEETPCD